jgi:RNase P/RNase MRP subunit p29
LSGILGSKSDKILVEGVSFMKTILGTTLALAALSLTPVLSMAQTAIRELQNANSTTISGQIIRLTDDDLVLDDGTGQILVEADDHPLQQENLSIGEQITVTGHYDNENTFDAILIRRTNGEEIYIFDD